MFKMTAAGDAINTIATIIQGKTLSVRSHTKLEYCGQKKANLLSDEKFIVACVCMNSLINWLLLFELVDDLSILILDRQRYNGC